MSKGAAIITGATGAIGKDISLGLAAEGYDIVLHYSKNKEKAEQIREQITSKGVQCELLQETFGHHTDYMGFISKAKESFGDCNVLINSASLFERESFLETSEATFDQHMNINVKACFFLTKYFASAFGSGSVINMLDSYMLKNKSPYFIYLLTKKMLHELTLMTAYELAPAIRVNAVSLGIMETEEGKGEYAALMQKKQETLPMKQLPQASSVVEAIRHLIDHQFYIGQCLFVDGGEHLT